MPNAKPDDLETLACDLLDVHRSRYEAIAQELLSNGKYSYLHLENLVEFTLKENRFHHQIHSLTGDEISSGFNLTNGSSEEKIFGICLQIALSEASLQLYGKSIS